MLGLYSADLVGSQGMPLTGNAVLSARQALVLIMSSSEPDTSAGGLEWVRPFQLAG